MWLRRRPEKRVNKGSLTDWRRGNADREVQANCESHQGLGWKKRVWKTVQKTIMGFVCQFHARPTCHSFFSEDESESKKCVKEKNRTCSRTGSERQLYLT